ncbi:hypothetical protein ACJJTC_012055 [Scirpophaga incertulas]
MVRDRPRRKKKAPGTDGVPSKVLTLALVHLEKRFRVLLNLSSVYACVNTYLPSDHDLSTASMVLQCINLNILLSITIPCSLLVLKEKKMARNSKDDEVVPALPGDLLFLPRCETGIDLRDEVRDAGRPDRLTRLTPN